MKIESISGLPGVAARIVEMLKERPVVAFHGAMGAGKTTLIREIARMMGIDDEVTSPTFALVNHYLAPCGRSVFHFDFYRLDNTAQALDMGAEEYFDSGSVCLIEWPERVEPLLPPDVLRVEILADPSDPDAREIVIE